jgi:hypothetical protein
MQETNKRKVSCLDLLATKLPKDIINYHIAPCFGVDLQARKEVLNHLNYLFRPSGSFLESSGILIRVETSLFSKKFFIKFPLFKNLWRDHYQYQSPNPLYKKKPLNAFYFLILRDLAQRKNI